MLKIGSRASVEQFAPQPHLEVEVEVEVPAEAADVDLLPRLRQRYA